MKIFYLLSIILLIFTFMKIKKSDKEQNILLWITLSIIIFMCYNSLSIFVLSLVNIRAYMFLRTIIYIALFIFIYYFYIKNKKTQKYFFDKKDLLAVGAILLVVLVVCHYRFGNDLHLNFEPTDPSVHYLHGRLFYENETLVGNIHTTTAYGNTYGGTSMFVSYTNLGTMMQILNMIIPEYLLYKVFIIFELCMLFLSGLLFYFTIKQNKKIKLLNTLFVIVISLMYMLGYPLNNLIFGFHYLGLGVLVINLLILLLDMFYNNGTNNKRLFYILISMTALSLFFTYYLFIPTVYAGVGLYILYKSLIKKEFSFKNAVKDIVVMLVIPFIIGMLYFFIIPKFVNTGAGGAGASALVYEGYIYRNLMGNFLFLIPLVLYKFYISFKSKKFDIYDFLFVICAISVLLFFGLVVLDKCSTYYFYKFYFPLWLMLYLSIGILVIDTKNVTPLVKVYVYSYAAIILVMASDVEMRMYERNILLDSSPSTYGITEIYAFNVKKSKARSTTISDLKLDLINYAKQNDLVDNGFILVQGSFLENLWIQGVYNIIPIHNYNALYQFYNDNISLSEISESKDIKYFVCFYDNEFYQSNIEKLKKYKIVYSNDSGVIYEK